MPIITKYHKNKQKSYKNIFFVKTKKNVPPGNQLIVPIIHEGFILKKDIPEDIKENITSMTINWQGRLYMFTTSKISYNDKASYLLAEFKNSNNVSKNIPFYIDREKRKIVAHIPKGNNLEPLLCT